jgi:hypothetical protein
LKHQKFPFASLKKHILVQAVALTNGESDVPVAALTLASSDF